MNDIAIWLFAAAVYGTLAFPFVLGVAAWRAPAGRRRRRALVVTGWWVAFCVVAGVGRLFTNDGYYSPDHITYWEHPAAAVVGVAWTMDVATLVGGRARRALSPRGPAAQPSPRSAIWRFASAVFPSSSIPSFRLTPSVRSNWMSP